MRNLSVLVALLALLTFSNACRNRQQASEQSSDSTTAATESAPAPSTEATIAGRIAELGLTPDSDWRGISLGDEFAKIKTIEKGEPFESDAKHVGYTVEFKNLESADMLYYQANQKVSAIEVDLFLNSRESATACQKELGAYFTSRYGSSKPAEGGTVWSGSQGQSVTLKDVSKGKDFGLKIRIAPANAITTASAR
ncbi:hypothetical protein ACFSUS_27740 [Spirosoma soli]|uniref:Lipoprotein n=1 Tax=Spirosoma soli TaxID=1770529 RepID=A0ABW5MD69_9BACT